MSYYKTCPHCGAHLDPGERCDCRGSLIAEIKSMSEAECSLMLGAVHIYMRHPDWTPEQCVEKAALDATNIQSGKVEQDLPGTDSTSDDNTDRRRMQAWLSE